MTHPPHRQVWLAYAMGITSGILGTLIYGRLDDSPSEADVAQYSEVRDFVEQTYVKRMDADEILTRSLRGLTRSLDPYSRYYNAEESNKLELETAGNYPGIGVVMRRIEDRQRVLFCMPGSPASAAGLQPGDEILAVDGVLASTLAWEDFSLRMRGPEGSKVSLSVANLDGEQRELAVQRALVPDPSVRHAEMLPGEMGLGYVCVRTFSRRTPTEFDESIERLLAQGMRGLIIDLRGNLGGVMESALAMADRFIDRGVLLRTESRRSIELHEASLDATRWPDLPLIVLVDGDSASASEILAAALQDHRRAALVGTPTYGKGMVQTIRQLRKFGTRVKVTSAYYYSPSGRLFERSAEEDKSHGIVPDVYIELDAEQERTTSQFLDSYSAPAEAQAALERWQKLESRTLIPEVPRDDHLLAAIDLFHGVRPSAIVAKANSVQEPKER